MMLGMVEEPVPQVLAEWLGANVDAAGPFAWQRLTGGNSNDTYLVSAGDWQAILRRPPVATIDPSAHSVARENRIMQALRDTPAPAPEPLAFCDDIDVLGVPFLVMECVPGYAIKDELPADAPPQPRAAREIGEALIDALAALHTVAWREVGLADFGRPEAFLERQVPRWTKQYQRVQVRELPRFDEVAAALERLRPENPEPAIVHGDFHADNSLIVFDEPARVSAILDWEMATIGDPMLDVAMLLAFWGDDDRSETRAFPELQAFSRADGAPTRDELAQRYAAATGRSVERLDFYMALVLWKLAAIIEGAYAAYVAGQTDSAYTRSLEHVVPALLEESAHHAGLD
jgi:aminoglycoside phosphotransferase (APT) family kinase protein